MLGLGLTLRDGWGWDLGCSTMALQGDHSDSAGLQDVFGSVITIIRNKYEENGLLG